MSYTKDRNLALFDFDNTITVKDTLFDFHIFTFGLYKTCLALLSSFPYVIRSQISMINSQQSKEIFLRFFWEKAEYDFFKRSCLKYTEEHLNSIIREKATRKIKYHRDHGDYIVVVTASIQEWVEPWCYANGVDHVIASKAEKINGFLTGHLKGKNCKGIEKVSRINKELDLASFRKVYAYGDSNGDKAMLALADEQYYRWRRI